jgi:hypothetical protein
MDQLWLALAWVAIGNRTPWLFALLRRHLRGNEAREQSEVERLIRRVGDLEDLIDTLRKALDRHLIRESAIASACELLIMLASLVEKPDEAMLRIRDRARQLLQDARAQTTRINNRKGGA